MKKLKKFRVYASDEDGQNGYFTVSSESVPVEGCEYVNDSGGKVIVIDGDFTFKIA